MSDIQTGTQINVRRGLGSLAEGFVRRIKGGSQAWDAGVGEVVKAAIDESGLPSSTTPVELARHLGILPKVKK